MKLFEGWSEKIFGISEEKKEYLKGEKNGKDEQNKKKIHGLDNTTVDKEISAVNYETTLHTKDGLEIPIEIYNINSSW